MTTTISTRNSGATIEWNGYHWVAELNDRRYADCNYERLTKRLYDAGASVVFEVVEIPTQRTTVWKRLRKAASALLTLRRES